ncbi:MAG: 50S ribosomal protein L25 [Patescibacteria group bacterium]|nr:MAG: 50S ribosomal protein L25 [Patescibacteria group bacterium]
MDHVLNVQPRTQRGKSLNKYRKAGQIPGNIYGLSEASAAVWINAKELNQVLAHSHVGSLIYLQYVDRKERIPVILRQLDSSLRSKNYTHLELQKINLNEEVTIEVQLKLTGEAPALKAGYLLETPVSSVELSVLPTSIPEVLTIDVSNLSSLDDHVTVADLQLPKGVTVLTEPHTVLVAVVEPTQEVEEAAPEDEAAQIAATQATATQSEESSTKN